MSGQARVSGRDLSGNPLPWLRADTAEIFVRTSRGVYTGLEEKRRAFVRRHGKLLQKKGLPWRVNHVASLANLFFTEEPVVDYTTAKTSDTVRFSDIFSEC